MQQPLVAALPDEQSNDAEEAWLDVTPVLGVEVEVVLGVEVVVVAEQVLGVGVVELEQVLGVVSIVEQAAQ